MSEEKRPRQKELPQNQARGYAREVIDGLFGAGDWGNLHSRIGMLPAAHRRTVLEAATEVPIPKDGRAERSRVLELALAGLRPGPARNADFVHSLVGASFEFCRHVDPGFELGILKEVLAKILRSTLDSDKDLSEILQIDAEKLIKIDSFAMAIVKLLESADHEDLMRKTIGSWGGLVGAHLAARRELTGLSRPAAAAALQRMAGLSFTSIPSELILSVPWLVQIAGGISPEFSEASPFSFIPTSLKDTSSASVGNQQATARPVPAASAMEVEVPQAGNSEPGVSKVTLALVTEIEKVVNRYEATNEERRANLSAQLAKATQEVAQKQAELGKNKEEIVALEANSQSLNWTLNRLKEQLQQLDTECNRIKEECAKWQKEAELLLASKNQQIEDAKAEVRRELKRSTLSQLSNLRAYVIELESLKTGPAKFAATTLDEVIRTFHRQGYVTAVELPRIRQPKSEESGT